MEHQVKSYTRKGKGGKTVTVRAYSRRGGKGNAKSFNDVTSQASRLNHKTRMAWVDAKNAGASQEYLDRLEQRGKRIRTAASKMQINIMNGSSRRKGGFDPDKKVSVAMRSGKRKSCNK